MGLKLFPNFASLDDSIFFFPITESDSVFSAWIISLFHSTTVIICFAELSCLSLLQGQLPQWALSCLYLKKRLL